MIDQNLKSFVDVAEDSDFPIQNLPFGIGKIGDEKPAVCSIIGDYVVDVRAVFELGFLDNIELDPNSLDQIVLNDFIAQGKQVTNAVRQRLAEVLSFDNVVAKQKSHGFLHAVQEVELMMPVRVGDYTDFYSSREHATNVGTMFRDPANALLPNWLHLPVGYHGRASSIVVSGTEIHRPHGQTMPAGADQPVFGLTKLLDFELEMAFVVGKQTELGQPISTADAENHIFGVALFNDWSARDIQKWEYVPLGPFLAKSFASTVSPWIVTIEALELLKVDGPQQDPPVLPYLAYDGQKNYDIDLEVEIISADSQGKVVCHSNFKYMYWNMAQQLAHHSINGCNFNVGDMCASGTISGKDESSYGSMLELTWRGSKPILMPDGSERKFIQDGDTVAMRGWGQKNGVRIGFGEAKGKII